MACGWHKISTVSTEKLKLHTLVMFMRNCLTGRDIFHSQGYILGECRDYVSLRKTNPGTVYKISDDMDLIYSLVIFNWFYLGL